MFVSDVYCSAKVRPNSTKYSSKAGAHQLNNAKPKRVYKGKKTNVIRL